MSRQFAALCCGDGNALAAFHCAVVAASTAADGGDGAVEDEPTARDRVIDGVARSGGSCAGGRFARVQLGRTGRVEPLA